ncbi:MAG: carboxymuconolactone decarboxylase, partial [Pyrinomonadaceae bacterium]|nr:carboxymuconolactone decarboxylase [Sphingobacteriaceae bacterium]
LIAAYVSSKNDCMFCMSSHAAAARYLYKDEKGVVDFVLRDYNEALISEKLKALLNIAGKVQQDARTVSQEDVSHAKTTGATEQEIHDTVLIAASFCMFNRYVDGLASLTPPDSADYETMGERMVEMGYALPKKD